MDNENENNLFNQNGAIDDQQNQNQQNQNHQQNQLDILNRGMNAEQQNEAHQNVLSGSLGFMIELL